jgi:hypothetical protein
MTLQEFIDETGIASTSEWAERNPHMEDSDRMDNWRVRLRSRNTGRTMRLYYSKGVGHNGAKPETDEVLDCLAMDASGIDNARGFEDWCSEYGYDTDSRSAEKTYKVCIRQAERLRGFLGDDGYRVLLEDIERL